jgi:hypothetical protein
MHCVPAVLGKPQHKINSSEYLDTISLINLYERLIHAAIQ